MAIDKSLLAPPEITEPEVRSLVDEFVANGGKIRKCKEGVALNYRYEMGEGDEPLVTKPNRPVNRRKPKR